jgi:hypothetical protein
MKSWISLAIAVLLCVPAVRVEAADYPARFRGVCQHCGRDLMAYWRPVECTDGRIVTQWVNECHDHCRPAYLGRKRRDFFNSHLMNPANPRRNARRNCLPNASFAAAPPTSRRGSVCCR